MANLHSLLLLCTVVLLAGCAKSERPRAQDQTVPIPSPSPIASVAAKPSQAKQIDKTWTIKFDFATRKLNRAHNGIRSYEISVEYPEIKQPTAHTLRFNSWIRRKVQGYVHEFQGLEQRAEAQDLRRKLGPVQITETLKIWFLVYYADEQLVSLRLSHSVMAIGQMHPITYYETINYDLKRGRLLSQHDVFKKNYLKAFSRYCRKFIPENYELNPTEDWFQKGTEAKRSNFPNWNIVPDGILIAFEDYQIASHSFGQLELIIPYSELREVLKPSAVIFIR